MPPLKPKFEEEARQRRAISAKNNQPQNLNVEKIPYLDLGKAREKLPPSSASMSGMSAALASSCLVLIDTVTPTSLQMAVTPGLNPDSDAFSRLGFSSR
jgi:hypothetical protein